MTITRKPPRPRLHFWPAGSQYRKTTRHWETVWGLAGTDWHGTRSQAQLYAQDRRCTPEFHQTKAQAEAAAKLQALA